LARSPEPLQNFTKKQNKTWNIIRPYIGKQNRAYICKQNKAWKQKHNRTYGKQKMNIGM
jgi:hypothetical protein